MIPALASVKKRSHPAALFLGLLLFLLLPPSSLALSPDDYFRIKVVDARTGRGVPLVRVETVHNLRFWTDSAGVAAIHEPALMGKKVKFNIDSHGYQFEGPSGREGIRLTVEPGESRIVQVQRENVAERLYRVTGQGIYRHSVRLGEKTPLREPVLNARIVGQDSVLNAVYKGDLFWFWMDTILTRGFRFRSTGAVSQLPESGGLDPAKGVNLDYFEDANGTARRMFSEDLESPIWHSHLMVVENDLGQQEMYTHYTQIQSFNLAPPGNAESARISFLRNASLNVPNPHGLALWDDGQERFEPVVTLPKDMRIRFPANTVRIRAEGREWFYFSSPFLGIRVPAEGDAIRDPDQYQTFTPLAPESRWDDPELDLDENGDPNWDWKSRTPSVNDLREAVLVFDGVLPSDQTVFNLTDVQTGSDILSPIGTVYWNEYREKWVLLGIQAFGRSIAGEIWYSEGDSPLGPWTYARKIATHDQKACYGLKQHRALDQEPDRKIIFECTYDNLLEPSAPSAHYKYNQVMFRLDLSDTRLHLPTPVYHFQDRTGAHRFQTLGGLRSSSSGGGGANRTRGITGSDPNSLARTSPVPFYALPTDRPRENSVPVWEKIERNRGIGGGNRSVALTLTKPSSARADSPVFHAFPPDQSTENPDIVDVFEYRNLLSGRIMYRPEIFAPESQIWIRSSTPVFKAWGSPLLDPPGDPSAEPVERCMGSSAVCD